MIEQYAFYFNKCFKISDKEYKLECPFCGANNSKARIYDNNGLMIIKCFKCSSLELLTKYLIDNGLLSFSTKDIKKKLKEVVLDTNKLLKEINKESKEINYKIHKAKDIDLCNNYLIDRQIPKNIIDKFIGTLDTKQQYTNIVTQLKLPLDKLNKCPTTPSITIPYYSENGLTRIQSRLLQGNIRYYSISIKEEAGVFSYSDDKNYPEYCCEGAFDSCFIKNCVAVGNNNLVSVPNRTLIYDNEPRNKIQMGLMRKAINLNRKVVIFSSDVKSKDINDMVKNREIKDIESYLVKHTYHGINALLKFKDYTNF